MITVFPYDQLGKADHGWLMARHHFSFAQYYNPSRMGFGPLRVINDDIIKAGAGFDMHPHKDMEIITYIRKGAISHQDSQGNKGRTVAGNVQVMSAGTGIFHSEYNLESEDTNIFQIWIEPSELGIQPEWATADFPAEPVRETLPLLVSGDGTAPLTIRQNAKLFAGRLMEAAEIKHTVNGQAYLLVSEGEIELDGQPLSKGDGAEIIDIGAVSITAESDAEIIVIEVPAAA